MPSKKKKKEKKVFCLEDGCKQEGKSQGYCRLHYITAWKKIRVEKQEKAEKKLESFIERMTKKYPKTHLQKIKEALESEEAFQGALQALDFEHDPGTRETEVEFIEKFSRKNKIGNED